MAAPDIDTLFNLERNFEKAAQAVLAAASVTSFIDEQAVKLPLIWTGIGCDCGPALQEQEFIPAPGNWPIGQAPPQEYVGFPMQMEIRVEVPLDDNTPTNVNVDTMLEQIRSRVRAAFLRVVMPFNDANCPYYRVSDIRPEGSQLATEQPRNVAFLSMRFSITFRIKPDAWPAWITA